jgi:cob(I)alamin adenosyltransferase
LGVARAESLSASLDGLLARVQNELFEVGAELATPDPEKRGTRTIGRRQIAVLEGEIDEREARLAPLAAFILPGGTRAAAALHLARTICRRAERRLVALVREAGPEISLDLLAYLNRLGDLLFVLARTANAEAGAPDVPWKRSPAAAAEHRNADA